MRVIADVDAAIIQLLLAATETIELPRERLAFQQAWADGTIPLALHNIEPARIIVERKDFHRVATDLDLTFSLYPIDQPLDGRIIIVGGPEALGLWCYDEQSAPQRMGFVVFPEAVCVVEVIHRPTIWEWILADSV